MLHNIGLSYQHADVNPSECVVGQAFLQADSVSQALHLVFLGYLGAIPSGHKFSDVTVQARAGVAKALEYFYGDWREGYKSFSYSEPMSRSQTRPELGWIDPYREGLLLALYVDDETAIRRLIEWPDTDLPVDDGYFNLTAGDNLVQIACSPADSGASRKRRCRANRREASGREGKKGGRFLGGRRRKP